jgi:hypothetical protein
VNYLQRPQLLLDFLMRSLIFCLHESSRPHGRPWSSSPLTQRGNRREAIFFEDGDQQIYCDMLAPGRKAVTILVGEQLNLLQ